jgi:NDP-sugar pyrophosphorylase family protein
MKAMVLAAGLGTRLRPLTDDRPKALVEICGRTLLEITLTRLRKFGVSDVIINVHHFAEMMQQYLARNGNFGMRIAISREEILLDTGGGLKKAAWFFQQGPADDPFLLHNVDVVSTIDLQQMMEFHQRQDALATLAVQERKSSRYLLFDPQLQLCGRRFEEQQKSEIVREVAEPAPLAFSGVHVISPRLLRQIVEKDCFSIIETYLRLAKAGDRVMGFRADKFYWRDLGRPESIANAEKDLGRDPSLF